MTNATEQAAYDSPEFSVKDNRRFAEDGELTGAGELDELRERVTAAEQRAEAAERLSREHSDKFSQAQKQAEAETSALRQRLNRNFEQKLDTAKGEIIASLLDSLDNMRRAVWAADKAENPETAVKGLLEGVKATMGLFESRMREHGLIPLPAEGEEFNPEFHEAVEIVAVPAEQDNKVVAEFQPGYQYGEKLLRPARVRVGRASS
jgi:molecular chaperone GrpE